MKTKHISTAIMGTVILLLFTALPAYADAPVTPFDNPVGGLGLLLFVSCIVGGVVSLLVRVIIAFGRKKSQGSTTQPETAEEKAALNITAVITLLLAVGLMYFLTVDFHRREIEVIVILFCCFVCSTAVYIVAREKSVFRRKKTETAEEKAALNKKRRKLTPLIALLCGVGLTCLFFGNFRYVDSVEDIIPLLFTSGILFILGYVGARAGSVTLTFRRKKKSLPQPETANAVTSEPAQNKEETKEETK